ncbi:MAG: hypothetical protein MJ246_03350 [Clostridia bacterium]|nr:hypothetical protein [Clostridia bacterium]
MKPPFEITNEILNLVTNITEKANKITSYNYLNKRPELRRNKRIRSIHSSLAIEANSLSLNEVKDIIDGKKVIGDRKEIQEVKNAYKAYEMLPDLNPFSITDLKKAHSIMTSRILNDNGKFRNHDEGIYDGEQVIFVCPPPDFVPNLMNDLFN